VVSDPVNRARGVTDAGLPGWSHSLAAALGIADWSRLYPPVSASIGPRGTITEGAARQTGLPVGLPIMAAMLDAAASLLGAGIAQPGDALTVLGTTALSAVVAEGPVWEPEMIGFNWPMPTRGWARNLASMAGTTNADWAARLLGFRGRGGAARLAALAEGAPAGAGGCVFLPFTAPGGERAPFVKPSACAGFVGLNAETSRAILARSVLEGVALAIRHCYASLPPAKAPVRITGGGSRSRAWCQIIADTLGREVIRVDVEEPGATGVAMAAAAAIGDITSVATAAEDWVRLGERYRPTEAARIYDALYRLYTHAIDSQSKLWDERATTSWPIVVSQVAEDARLIQPARAGIDPRTLTRRCQ
jgi:sugar (pentulose or hexulose) kinase